MSDETTKETYQAYLLRFWRREEGEPWHVTVQPVDEAHNQHHFASVEEGLAYVRQQLGLTEEDEV